jgi:hypothetical protein
MSVRRPEQNHGKYGVCSRLQVWHEPCKVRAFGRPTSATGANKTEMALPFGETPGARDSRALSILAKTIYRELRASGFQARDLIALAGELLAQVTREMRARGVPGEKQS